MEVHRVISSMVTSFSWLHHSQSSMKGQVKEQLLVWMKTHFQNHALWYGLAHIVFMNVELHTKQLDTLSSFILSQTLTPKNSFAA